MITTSSLESLIGYLATCGGTDRFVFHDDHGEPDPVRARACAEELRERLGDHLDVLIEVRQKANAVIITALTQPVHS